MSSWSDATLSNLDSWVAWLGVAMTFLGFLGMILGIMINNEMSRRDAKKDEEREEKIATLETNITAAKKEAIERADEAHKLATRTNERQAGRQITEEQALQFFNRTKDLPKASVRMSLGTNTAEATTYAKLLVKLLEMCGYGVPNTPGGISGAVSVSVPPIIGVLIEAKDVNQPNAIGLRDALEAICEGKVHLRPDSHLPQSMVRIIVGDRPGPGVK